MPAVEKKNDTLGIRMSESMMAALKGIADAEKLTVSELVINLVSREIEERRAYWSRLDSIFRDTELTINAIRVDQRDTGLLTGAHTGRNAK